MKIVVIDFAASKGGALSVLKDFSEVAFLYKDIEWYFILSDYYIKQRDNIKVIIQKKDMINRLFFDYIIGRKIIKKINPDIVFNLQNTGVYGLSCSQVIYIHQSIPFQNDIKFSFLKRSEIKLAVVQKILGKKIKRGLKLANKIIVQTETMKEEVAKYKAKNSSVVTIYPEIVNEKKATQHTIDFTTFFYPTSDQIYKNNQIILDAANFIEKYYPNNKLSFYLTINGLSSKNINYLGKIKREDVIENMTKMVLIFPSLIESFPFPLMEAKSVGTYIIAADTKFCRELLNEYPNKIFFNPYDVEDLAKTIIKISKKNPYLIEYSVKEDYLTGWNKVISELIKMIRVGRKI